MKKEGRYRLIKQIGGRGFYIDVKVLVQPVQEEQTSIIWDESCAYWRPSILFAFEYYREHYRRSLRGGLQVEITSIHSTAVDTTTIVAVYGVIKAIEQAVGYEIGSPILNKAGEVVFTK